MLNRKYFIRLSHMNKMSQFGQKREISFLIKSNESKVQGSKLYPHLLCKLFLSSTEPEIVNNSESLNDASD